MARTGAAGAEDYRIAMQARLETLLRGDEESIAFSPELTAEERAFLHALAPKFGLTTKSRGQKDRRYITVAKPNKENSASSVPLELCGNSQRLLSSHFQRHAMAAEECHLRDDDEEQETTQQVSKRQQPQGFYKRLAFDAAVFDVKKRDSLAKVRRALPAWAYREKVANAVAKSEVVLIAGETGCGKSTQVPQFVLEDLDRAAALSKKKKDYCKIACSQPRRLSAMAVAERVAAERGEQVGQTVGYRVRFEAATSKATRLVFLTPGVLLRKLWQDPWLEEFSHVILDEVHEEDMDTEMLLVVLRELVARRSSGNRPLRLVLMSATLASEKLERYFSNAYPALPKLTIGASTHPVTTFFLDEVLKQTGFGKRLIGAKPRRDVASGLEALDLSTRTAVEGAKARVCDLGLVCAACGRSGFASPEELGDHAAECFGSDVVEEDDHADDAGVLADVIYNAAAVIMPSPPPGLALSLNDNDDDDDDERRPQFTWLAKMSSSSTADPEVEAMIRTYHRGAPEFVVDVDLVCALLTYITNSAYDKGAVVIFVSGWGEIAAVLTMIAKHEELGPLCWALPLHGSIESSKQRQAFEEPPAGKWKIVVATNVAETSVTIPDVSFVIDCGLEKQLAHDEYLGASVLRSCWISRASAQQRKGRAGRTRPGICFRLYTARRFESMEPQRKSGLLRANLDSLCLHASALGEALEKKHDSDFKGSAARRFLASALNAPRPASVEAAIQALIALGAVEPVAETVTALGRCLAKIPLSPRLGLAALYARLLLPVTPTKKQHETTTNAGLYLVCSLEAKDPFIVTADGENRAKAARREFAGNSESDVVALAKACEAFALAKRKSYGAANGFCRDHSASFSSMALVDSAVSQLNRELPSLGSSTMALPMPMINAALRALATAALYPNVALRRQSETSYTTRSGARCKLHNSSLAARKGGNYDSGTPSISEKPQFIAFSALLERGGEAAKRQFNSSGLALATTTPSTPLALMLLCHARARREAVDSERSLLVLDAKGFLRFEADNQTLDFLLALRFRLRQALELLVNDSKTSALPAVLAEALSTATLLLTAEQQQLAPPPQAPPPGYHAPSPLVSPPTKQKRNNTANNSTAKSSSSSAAAAASSPPRSNSSSSKPSASANKKRGNAAAAILARRDHAAPST